MHLILVITNLNFSGAIKSITPDNYYVVLKKYLRTHKIPRKSI